MAYVYKRNGSPFYQCCIETPGGPRRLSTKERTKQKAEQAAERLEKQAQLEAEDSLTLLEAAARMFRRPDLKPKTIEGYKASLSNIHGVLGDFKLGALTPHRVQHYIHERRKERKLVTVRAPKGDKSKPKSKLVPYASDARIVNDLAFLSSLYKSAMTWQGSGVTENPVYHHSVKMLKLKKPEGRTSALSVAEIRNLLDNCRNEHHKLFVMLSVDTGMRLRETLHLKWDEVDFDEGVIRLRGKTRTKTGGYRIIPLTERCLLTLRNTNDSTKSVFVFPGRGSTPENDFPMDTIKTFWRRVTADAGLEGVRIHDLRHTFASLARDSGMDPLFAQEMMGHRTGSMTNRYSHPSSEAIRAAIVKFECTKDYTKAPDQNQRA